MANDLPLQELNGDMTSESNSPRHRESFKDRKARLLSRDSQRNRLTSLASDSRYNQSKQGTSNSAFEENDYDSPNNLSKQAIQLTPHTIPPLDNAESAIEVLNSVIDCLGEDEDLFEEIRAVQNICEEQEFQSALQLYNNSLTNWSSPLGVVTTPNELIHNKENEYKDSNQARQTSYHKHAEPLTSATDRLVNELRNNLSTVYQSEAQQLLSLLYSPHLQVLFPTHDEVALMREEEVNDKQASNNDLNSNSKLISMMNNSDDLQIIRISKTVDALGATIKHDGEDVVISRVLTGGLIDKTGQLNAKYLKIIEIFYARKTVIFLILFRKEI